jgi:hypothetical protein
MVQRPDVVDGRAELVQALEIVREQLYRPLETDERTRLERDLTNVLDNDPDRLHQDMARQLIMLVRADTRTIPETLPAWWLRIGNRLTTWLTERRIRWLTGIGMTLLGLITLKNPFQLWLENTMPDSVLLAFLQANSGKQIIVVDSPVLYNSRLVLEVLVGLLLLLSVGLLVARKVRLAFNLGYFSLLVSLAVLDMLLFYFEQFSTILIVLLQFVVLFGGLFYRRRYLTRSN